MSTRSRDVLVEEFSARADYGANWLPAPQGSLRPMMRMYQLRDEVLNGSYVRPAIRKAA